MPVSPALPADALRQARTAFSTASALWWQEDAPQCVFVAKTCIAALLALWIAFRLDFAQPQWSLLTVFIVARRESGLVMTKSFYRLLGTLAGSSMALLLVAWFAQTGELFLLALTLWISACTALATRYRNFQSYSCMLAGYTAAIVGFGAAGSPGNAFDIALSRVSEVLLGILCAGVVAEAVLPQHAAASLLRTADARFARFIDFLQQCFAQQLSTEQMQNLHHGFVADVIALENRRGSTFFESTQTRARDARLRGMNAAFMAASTSLHGYMQSMARLRRQVAPPALGVITKQYAALGAILIAGDAAAMISPLRQYRRQLSGDLGGLRHTLIALADTSHRDGALSALALYDDVVDKLLAYVEASAALHAPRHTAVPNAAQFTVHTDAFASFLAGLRTAGVMLVLAAFWILTAWRNGPGAITIAAVFCVLFSSQPAPMITIKRFARGFAGGLLLAYGCLFTLLPAAEGFPTMALALLPLLALSAWMIEQPRFSSEGAGMYIVMFVAIAPRNVMDYNIVNFLNGAIASFLGLAAAGLAFALLPLSAVRLRRRLLAALRRLAIQACVSPLRGQRLRHHFESRSRDLMFQLASPPVSLLDPEKHSLGSALSVLELGHAVIAMRLALREQPTVTQSPLPAVAQACQLPTQWRREQAMQALRQFLDALPDSQENVALRLSCHHLDSVLRDDDWFTAMTRDAALATAMPGERHAL